MILLRALICLSFLATPLFSQWFWEEHYYEIPSGGEKYYSKGKPRIEGEFTVFNKWPENLEWRIKTQHVKAIKDIGPLSPSEIDAKELTERENLRSIFKVILSLAEVVQKKDSQQAPVSKQTSSSEFDIDVFLNHYSKLNIYSTSDLKIARSRNYSDDEIWAILVKEDSAFSEARKSGFSLDRIAKFFDQEARQ